MDFFLDDMYGKALLGICVVGLLIYAVSFVLKTLMPFRMNKEMGKMTRILDVCHVGQDRKIIHFSSPFSQGILLISPRGDQIILFPEGKDDGSRL